MVVCLAARALSRRSPTVVANASRSCTLDVVAIRIASPRWQNAKDCAQIAERAVKRAVSMDKLVRLGKLVRWASIFILLLSSEF